MRGLLTSLLLLLAIPLAAQDKGEVRAYFGVMAASEHRVGYSLALTGLKVGPTRSGLLIGYIGSLDTSPKTPANMTYAELQPGRMSVTSQRKGYQVGYFADLGRGYFSVGFETDVKTTSAWSVAQDKTVTALDDVETKKSGAYAQVGFRGRVFGIYGHFGATTGVGVGVSVHFSLN
jgi:hypothetical protein